MKKILFISFQNPVDNPNGGAKGAVRNYSCLSQCGKVFIYTLTKKSTLKSLLSILGRRFPPVLQADARAIESLIKEKSIDVLYLDSSLLGCISKQIRKKYPNIAIIANYRNCEYDYINVRFNSNQCFRRTIYSWLAKKEERIETECADTHIVLTSRCKKRIEELYGKHVEFVIPQSMIDTFHTVEYDVGEDDEFSVLLFGPSLMVNVEAVRWFVQNVAPYIDARIIIAGKGMDAYRDEFASGNVKVHGFVEDLNQLYASVHCVVIPLLRGAGMKFKTVEAMMHGKYIFGSTEAFEGFDIELDGIGDICDTAEDYITKIRAWISKKPSRFNSKSRKAFLENYSIEKTMEIYRSIFDFTKQGDKCGHI